MVADLFSALMCAAIRMRNSPICGASGSACPAESVDDEVYGTIVRFPIMSVGRSLRRESSEAVAFEGLPENLY